MFFETFLQTYYKFQLKRYKTLNTLTLTQNTYFFAKTQWGSLCKARVREERPNSDVRASTSLQFRSPVVPLTTPRTVSEIFASFPPYPVYHNWVTLTSGIRFQENICLQFSLGKKDSYWLYQINRCKQCYHILEYCCVFIYIIIYTMTQN